MAVLSTKLHVPSPRHALVPRPRLSDSLDRGEAHLPRVLLVAAPAGFGKTTFVSQWLATAPAARPAWLSLDTGDNDPRLFLSGLIAALRTVEARSARVRSRCSRPARQLPTDAVLTSLVNDLDQLGEHTVLVLDDLHVVDNLLVHQALQFLLDHLPHHVTLVICSREDPPLPLALLRSRGELVEVRAEHLRFTTAEAGALLNQVMQLDLTDSDVAGPRDAHRGLGSRAAAGCAVDARARRPDAPSSTPSPAVIGSSSTTSSRRSCVGNLITSTGSCSTPPYWPR